MTDTLVATPYVDADPCPRVGIDISNLHPTETSVVAIYRTADGDRRVVRGCEQRAVVGGDYVVDFEVPLGRPVTYDLVLISGPTTPPDDRPTVTVNATSGWLQDPLVPSSAVQVSGGDATGATIELLPTAFQELTYRAAVMTTPILGSRYPGAIGGARLAAAGVDFSMLTSTAEQCTALRELLMTAFPVLLRPLPSWGNLPPLMYLAPGEAVELPVNTALGGTLTRWELSGSLVSPPALDIVVPLWTYADVEALWVSYQQAQAAASAIGATYLDEIRDPQFNGGA